MKVISLRGLDNNGNIAINNAISIASKLGSKEIDSSHLMYVVVKNDKIAIAFKNDTGVEADLYRKTFETIHESNLISKDSEMELSIDDISEELKLILKGLLARVAQNNKTASIYDLYKEVIKTRSSAAWGVMEMLGINKDAAIDNILNPLEEMEIAAQFSIDYNLLAKNGRFDPIESRDNEIDKVFEILGRRIKNNPCIVGEAGVGKTAIVEGIAQRLISGNVPSYIKGKHIISVDISGIIAGTKYRGDFEERLNGLLNEAAKRDDVILFFDEFHMLADAGSSSSESSITALNILKPAISRGDVQIIGATTTSEYKKYIEKDKAFERRIQKVVVSEPSIEDAIKMVNSVIVEYDNFHGCVTSEEAIEAAVILSDRYITDKRLPDKAITIIDETAARLKKLDIFDDTMQITASDIKETISKTTGIDINDMDEKSRSAVKSLAERLMKRVIGQNDAVNSISKAIMRNKAGVRDPNRPIGSFLFVGPTGVGKTELTKALAIEFSGGIKNLIRFDMSEFMEKHSVSKLIGAPPGYIGYGEGGQLTEAIRNKPYSVVLFDEIEKAHPDIFNLLLQVLDDGQLTDSEGTTVDFKNTVIIMTSNAGYGAVQSKKVAIGFNSSQDIIEDESDRKEKEAIKALESTFRPEFLNRLDKVVVFDKLNKDEISEIINITLNKLNERLHDQNIVIKWGDSLVSHLVSEGYSDKYGARNIKRKIQEDVEDKLADEIIDGNIKSGQIVQLEYEDRLMITVKEAHALAVNELNFM